MKDELRILREHLKRKGLKRTQQREVILRIFLELDDYLTIDGIGRAVQAQDKRIGLSTVYRSLKLFVESGLALEHHFLEGKTCYEKSRGRAEARDYLVCTQCGKVQAFSDPLIAAVLDKVSKGLKFAPKFNRLEVYGLCSDCRGPVDDD
jgi:Fur family transcriptional regulator, ferric uptake regulator